MQDSTLPNADNSVVTMLQNKERRELEFALHVSETANRQQVQDRLVALSIKNGTSLNPRRKREHRVQPPVYSQTKEPKIKAPLAVIRKRMSLADAKHKNLFASQRFGSPTHMTCEAVRPFLWASQKLAVLPLSSILPHGWQTAVEICDGLPVAALATGFMTDEQREALGPLLEGIQLTMRELLSVFKKHGIDPIVPEVGDKFDPQFHQAMFEAPVPGTKAGEIIQVAAEGFMLHDRLLRPAQVGVSSMPAS